MCKKGAALIKKKKTDIDHLLLYKTKMFNKLNTGGINLLANARLSTKTRTNLYGFVEFRMLLIHSPIEILCMHSQRTRVYS